MTSFCFLLVGMAISGCEGSSLALFSQYKDDQAFRRTTLEASLVNQSNGYSTRRLNSYALDSGWDALPIWNAATRPVMSADLGAFSDDIRRPSLPSEGTLAALPEMLPETEAELLELGRQAFERYPVQIDLDLSFALKDETSRQRYGLWKDDRQHIGGVVRVTLPGGAEGFATTCVTCHARVGEDQKVIHGAANTSFDRGLLAAEIIESGGVPGPDSFYEWGPGRLDVTANDGDNPVAISDLRPIRYQSHLHFTGSVRNGLIELAIRIETLMITSLNEQLRPPRVIPFAIAYYLWSLGSPNSSSALTADEEAGRILFQSKCTTCHKEDGLTSDPVDINLVGTNPDLESSNRNTGKYRVPSLFRVFDRRKLLHDASVSSISELLDPTRQATNPGHIFGNDLSESERELLRQFVLTIGR